MRSAKPVTTKNIIANRHFRKVFDAMPVGLLIVDQKARIQDANAAAVRLLRTSKKDLIAEKISDLFISSQKITGNRLWKGILNGNAPTVFEFQFQRSDGKFLEIGVSAKHNAVLGNFLVALQDITRRKTAEEAIQKQAHMLDFANDTIMIRDMNDIITYWNQGAERLYGWSRKEAIGKHVHTFLKTKFPEPVNTVLQKCIQDEHWEGVLVHTKRDGSLVTVASRWTLEKDEFGKPVAHLEINNDITERIRAEEELKKTHEELEKRVIERTRELSFANQQLKALSSKLMSAQEEERLRISRDLHDDLGQILTSIHLNHRRILQIDDPVKKKTLLEQVMAASQEAQTRVRELSYILRPRVLDEVGLKEAIQTYISEFQASTGVKSDFLFECRNKDFSEAAATTIYRILQEALTNISKHAQANEVSVQISVQNKNAILKIKDDGIGFDQNSIKIDKTLGLLGMKERTELMGGRFNVNSKPGRGTQLSISFPRKS
ncbi:MAG TPA: PAS domain S-box protein [Acidobacteriota bacterium]|nr:PAS domain S-box protein [Acidobacteriota bacterium]